MIFRKISETTSITIRHRRVAATIESIPPKSISIFNTEDSSRAGNPTFETREPNCGLSKYCVRLVRKMPNAPKSRIGVKAIESAENIDYSLM